METIKFILLAILLAVLAAAAILLIMAVPNDDLDTEKYVALLIGTKVVGAILAVLAARVGRHIKYRYLM